MRSFCAGQARALGALWADPELARPRGAAAAPALGPHGRRVCPLSSIREIAQSHRDMEQELAHAVNASSKAMDRVYSKPRTAEVPALFRSRPLRQSPRACCRVCVLVPAGADRQRCPGHGQQLQGSAQRDGAAAGREGGLGELGAGSRGGRPGAEGGAFWPRQSSRPQEAWPVVGGALGHVVTVSPAALRSPVDTNASVAVDGPGRRRGGVPGPVALFPGVPASLAELAPGRHGGPESRQSAQGEARGPGHPLLLKVEDMEGRGGGATSWKSQPGPRPGGLVLTPSPPPPSTSRRPEAAQLLSWVLTAPSAHGACRRGCPLPPTGAPRKQVKRQALRWDFPAGLVGSMIYVRRV